MAITLQATLSKKIPLPNCDFSSQSASLTISAEVSDPSHIAAEAFRLYALAEAAVDHQLGLDTSIQPASPTQVPAPIPVSVPAPEVPASRQTSTSTPRGVAPPRPSQASTPYRTASTRRSPAPITDSQLHLITRLLTESKTELSAVLHHHQIGSLRDLACKDASALIDELKRGIAA